MDLASPKMLLFGLGAKSCTTVESIPSVGAQNSDASFVSPGTCGVPSSRSTDIVMQFGSGMRTARAGGWSPPLGMHVDSAVDAHLFFVEYSSPAPDWVKRTPRTIEKTLSSEKRRQETVGFSSTIANLLNALCLRKAWNEGLNYLMVQV